MRTTMQAIGTQDGLFHDGNQATGDLGTIVTATWLNDVQAAVCSLQNELISVLSSAKLTPDAEKKDQLLTAIKAVIDASNTLAGFAKRTESNTWTKAQSGAVSALPATTGTVTLDLAQANNWEGVLTGSIVLANPSNATPGQSGVIRTTQGATPVAIAYGSVWKAASGVLPGLTSVAGAVDVMVYYVESASRILIAVIGDAK